jgi:hypothetical protein
VAVVANNYRGVEIFKLKKSVEPELKARIQGGNAYQYVSIHGDIAYAVSYFNLDFLTIDISRPSNPKIISNQDLGLNESGEIMYPSVFEIYGDVAFGIYIGISTSIVVIFDLFNPEEYRISGSFTLSTYAHDLTYDGYYLSVAGIFGDFYLFYYSNSISWDYITSVNTFYSIHDLYIYDEYLFMAESNNLTVFNISNPQNPTYVLSFHSMAAPWEGYSKVVVDSDIAYLVSEDGHELHFVNFEDFDRPHLEGVFQCNETILDITIDHDYVYMSCDVVNLEVLRLDRLIVPAARIAGPIIAAVVVIGVPIIMVVYYTKRKPERKTEPVEEEPTEVKFPDPEEIDIDIDPEDFEDIELFEYAQEIFDDE